MKRRIRRGPGVNLLVVLVGGPLALIAVFGAKVAMPTGAGIGGPSVLLVLAGVAVLSAVLWRTGDKVQRLIAAALVVLTLGAVMGALPL